MNKKQIYLIVVLLAVILLILGGILLFKNQQSKKSPTDQTGQPTATSTKRQLGENPTPQAKKEIAKITIPQTETVEQTVPIVESWIKIQPTYKFDGQNLALESSKKINDNVYRFIYKFESKYPGYGDRTGEAMNEAATNHIIEITAQSGRIIYALIDGRWDEIEQKLIY